MARAGSGLAGADADLVSLATGFAPELTPTWLGVAAVLGGQPSLDVADDLRVIDLKCRDGLGAAVIAAAHPRSTVVACDDDPENVEAARRLASEAELDNLSVVEVGVGDAVGDSRLPGDVDLIILRDVVSTVGDDARSAIARFAGRALRPGGYLAASYRTLSGWSELTPIRVVAKLAGRHAPTSRDDQASAAIELIRGLRAGGARYFEERPQLDDAVCRILDMPPAQFAELLLPEELQPMTMSTVASALDEAGCRYVGSARLEDGLGSGLTPWLRDLLDDVRDDRLREVLRDIATRCRTRTDLLRRGLVRQPADRILEDLIGLRLVSLVGPQADLAWDARAATVAEDLPIALPMLEAAAEELRQGAATVGQLLERSTADVTLVNAATLLRVLLSTGVAHPSVQAPDATAVERCRALNHAIARDPRRAPVLVSPVLGSAVRSSPAELSAFRTGVIERDAARAAVRRRPVLAALGIL